MIKPTQGRIVYFHEAGVQWPAMVTEVKDDRTISVKVFTATDIHSIGGVQLLQDDDKPRGGQWAEWMDFQKGQAAISVDDIKNLSIKFDDLAKVVNNLVGHNQTLIQRLQAAEARINKDVSDAVAPGAKK